jgi:GYD domain
LTNNVVAVDVRFGSLADATIYYAGELYRPRAQGRQRDSNRQDKSRDTARQFGIERKTVWMTFGPNDFVHLYEAPNDEAMAKFVMTLASFGNLRTTGAGYEGKIHLLPARQHR